MLNPYTTRRIKVTPAGTIVETDEQIIEQREAHTRGIKAEATVSETYAALKEAGVAQRPALHRKLAQAAQDAAQAWDDLMKASAL